MTNREKGIITDLRKKARSKSQDCYNPSCSNKAIRSHIHQAEGPIREIASTDGRIVQLENLNTFFEKKLYGFQEKGIKQKGDVLIFWGFCNNCDSQLFNPIENQNVDYSSYKNQLLFSYRGFLSEHYKQEYNLKHYELIFESNKLTDTIKEMYVQRYLEFSLDVKIGRTIKRLFEKNLKEVDVNDFNFISFKLPKIDVCTSSTYSLPLAIKIKSDEILKRESFPIAGNMNFVNLIPHGKHLNVILGCLSDENLKGRLDLKKIEKYDDKSKIKLISDILIRHIETWFISNSLYNIWNQRKLTTEIIRQIEKYFPVHMKNKHVKFNMFHDLI